MFQNWYYNWTPPLRHSKCSMTWSEVEIKMGKLGNSTLFWIWDLTGPQNLNDLLKYKFTDLVLTQTKRQCLANVWVKCCQNIWFCMFFLCWFSGKYCVRVMCSQDPYDDEKLWNPVSFAWMWVTGDPLEPGPPGARPRSGTQSQAPGAHCPQGLVGFSPKG